MKKSALLVLLFALPSATLPSLVAQTPSAQKLSAPVKRSALDLRRLALANDPGLREAVLATFSDADLKAGNAWVSFGQDFFFATRTDAHPLLVIDDDAEGPAGSAQAQTISMQPLGKPTEKPVLWYGFTQIPSVGRLHSFYYRIDGKNFGGSHDLAAFGPLSYLKPGVPSGKLSDKLIHTSRIYEGMQAPYWIYVPAEYDPKVPAALMVFQDGEGYTHRDSEPYVLNAIDNLIASKQIPVMICVFLNPGSVANAPGTETYKRVKKHSEEWHRTLDDAMRSTLYDTVSDRYPHYLRDEILAEVGAKYNLRKDAYSRGITGLSSGGICAFNAAWQTLDGVPQFSRVLTWIASYSSIQWHERPDVTEGGQDYPDMVQRGPKRNIRVWMQDGANDLQIPNWGDWPLANIRMANALKSHDYDFHFSFGTGTHNTGHGAAQFPESMIWLWRDYSPAKTEQVYDQEPAEKAEPLYRVRIANRDAN